jgi:hypothetical protein
MLAGHKALGRKALSIFQRPRPAQGEKFQLSNPNSQTSTKFQAPINKRPTAAWNLAFGIWSSFGAWRLELGICPPEVLDNREELG